MGTSSVCINDVCVASPLCDDGDLCTTDSCSNSTGTAVCTFVGKDCSNEPLDVCTNTQCDPATGTCSIPLPKTCTGVAPTSCEEYRCNVEQNGDCTLFPPDRCLVPGECRPTCGPNGNCTEGTGTQNSFCVCFDGWSGPQCYVPPCNLTCSQNGTCNTYLNPDCDVDGLLNKDIPGTRDPLGAQHCHRLLHRRPRHRSSSSLSSHPLAPQKVQTEIAELDAFANAESIGSNPLFKAGNDWQVSAIPAD